MPDRKRQKVKVFISYAHKDQSYFDVFIEELRDILKSSLDFDYDVWDDTNISAGSLWDESIQTNLANSDLALLLVSNRFLASDYIKTKEFGKLISKYPQTLTIPVLFAPCDFNQWDDLAKKQFFMPKGNDYGQIEKKDFTFSDLIQFGSANGIPIPIPNSNIERYVGHLAKKINISYSEHLKKKLILHSIPSETIINNTHLIATDLLAENLIRMPYLINDEYFIVPKNIISDKNTDFLLPVTDLYFKSFDEDTLIDMLSIEKVDTKEGDIKVSLTVPVKGDKKGSDVLTFTRYYDYGEPKNSQNGKIINLVDDEKDETINDIPSPFSIGIYPFLRTENRDYDDMYKIMLLSTKLVGIEPYQIKAYREGVEIEESSRAIENIKRFDRKVEGSNLAIYSVNNSTFDALEIITPYKGKTGKKARGWIIPKWKKTPNKDTKPKSFTVAVDIGTTNTFVAFTDDDVTSTGNIITHPFFIGTDDMQAVMLNKPMGNRKYSVFERYNFNDGNTGNLGLDPTFFQNRMFMPSLIGNPRGQDRFYNNLLNKFPIRTALIHSKDVQFEPFVNASISFLYEKEVLDIKRHGQEITTNLKWSADNARLVEVFIKQLLYMIRNKVLLNGGDLSQTKLVWLKPLSLSKRLTDNLTNTWNNLSKKILGECVTPKFINRCEATYFYYRSIGKIEKSSSVVSIDIGGENTNIALFADGSKSKLATSIYFGANILWEGRDTRDPNETVEGGIIYKYRNWFQGQVELMENNVDKLRFNQVMNSRELSSADKINFMFSNKHIDFTKKLSEDKDMLLLFLLHYAACIYHAVQLLAINGMPYPKDFYFSGTGSKYLNLLDVSESKDSIRKFTELFAKKVYDRYKDLSTEVEKLEDGYDTTFKQIDTLDKNDNGIFTDDFAENTNNKTINLHLPKEPKEVTCFGAIHSFAEAYKRLNLGRNINTVFLGEIDAKKSDFLPKKFLTHEDLIKENGISPTRLGNELANKISKNLDQFLELFLSMNKDSETHFENYNIKTNLERFEVFFKKMQQVEVAKAMISGRRQAFCGTHTPVRESFFFHPLRAIIREFALLMKKGRINN